MKPALFLILILISCSLISCSKNEKCTESTYLSGNTTLPDKVLRNYLTFPVSDTFLVYGVKDSSFRFLYTEKDPRVITQKTYLSEAYQMKMITLAQEACRKLLDNVHPDVRFLASYQMAISLYNIKVSDRPELSWPLYLLKQ